jgi:hypothetical protein
MNLSALPHSVDTEKEELWKRSFESGQHPRINIRGKQSFSTRYGPQQLPYVSLQPLSKSAHHKSIWADRTLT